MKITWIITAFLITMIPLFTGVLLTEISKKERTLGRTYIYGWISIFAVTELLALPSIFLGLSLTALTVAVSLVCVSIIAVGIFLTKKNILDYLKNSLGIIKKFNAIWTLPIAIILMQMYYYFMKVNTDADDAFYLATANTAVATDSIFKFNPYTGELYSQFPSRYVLSPLPIIYSIISKIGGMHVAVIAHTLMPVVLILVTYLVYVLIGRSLFKNDIEKTGMFLFYVALLFTFSAVSSHTTGVVFLVRIWQGKAMLASFLVPLIFATMLEIGRNSIGMRNAVLLMVILIACGFVSSMGILLGPLCLVMILIAYFVLDKKITWIFTGIVSCIPSVILAVIYLYIK